MKEEGLKYWKCPHCKKTEISETNVELVICPGCIDCNMDEVKVEEWNLFTTKPKDFKGFEEHGKQMCMRCNKEVAVKNDDFCERCINERKGIDESIKEIAKIKEERKSNR